MRSRAVSTSANIGDVYAQDEATVTTPAPAKPRRKYRRITLVSQIPVPRCPKCGSLDLDRTRSDVDKYGVGFKRYRCPECDIAFGIIFH